ncbi:flagellar hook-length control protein FliK [Stutzerimonas degradans]|nr:flagellar hook-length control protein [Stutzerimonas stutzeri TS44]QGW20350.1 flagellar hook-length control protein FliK [Stutzerimonas degradans]
MAVSPDLLLKSPTLEVRPKAAAAQPSPAPEASDGKRSSFSEVYARERQTKPVERKDDASASSREKVDEEQSAGEPTATADAEKPTVAESGNSLPGEEASDEPLPEGELDPLLLFGLNGQLPAPEPAAAQTEALTLMPGLGQTQLTPPLADAETQVSEDVSGESATTVAAPALTLKAAPTAVSPAAASETAAPAEDDFASLLQASSEPEPEVELEVALSEVSKGLDAPQDSRQPADPALGRASPLSQAITQQIQQAQRTPLVPGQPVAMQQAGWSEAVVDRVMWLSSQNLKSAEIQLDPAELGRMEVRIEMNREQAQITFLSPHAGVRDALEGQMQRLREMFDQQGMSMNVNVSDQSLARGWQGRGEGEAGRGGASPAATAGDDEQLQGVSEVASNRAVGNRGLVDYYA